MLVGMPLIARMLLCLAAVALPVTLGAPPENDSDGPLPPWAYALLAISIGFIARRRLQQV
jgi:hypothetical protein